MAERTSARTLMTLAIATVAGCLTLAGWGERVTLPRIAVGSETRVVDGDELKKILGKHEHQLYSAGGEGFRLYGNHSFGQRVVLDEARSLDLTWVARGTPVEGVFPYLMLRVNGEFHSAFYITSRRWGNFTTRIDLGAGTHDLEWSYANEAARFPEDRNLDLKALVYGELPDELQFARRWSAPCTLPPLRVAERSRGALEDDGFHLWPGGHLADEVYLDRAGIFQLSLQGSLAHESNEEALVEVRWDDRLMGHLRIDSRSRRRSLLIDSTRGSHRVELRVVGGAETREILIDNFSVGRVAPETALTTLKLSTGSASLTGASFAVRSGGDPVEGGWVLWTAGFMKQQVESDVDADFLLTVHARADLCGDEPPRLMVMRDDDQWVWLEIGSPDYRDYSVSIPLDAGRHDLSLVYENDLRLGKRCDRNVYIQRIELTREEG